MCIKTNKVGTGSRNLMGPKTLPTIWYTYMTLIVTEKNATKNILDGRTVVKQYTPLPLRGAGV